MYCLFLLFLIFNVGSEDDDMLGYKSKLFFFAFFFSYRKKKEGTRPKVQLNKTLPFWMLHLYISLREKPPFSWDHCSINRAKLLNENIYLGYQNLCHPVPRELTSNLVFVQPETKLWSQKKFKKMVPYWDLTTCPN